MKIGFDAKRAFLNASGLGNYSRNTINALHQYNAEHQLILFTPEIKNELFSNHGQFEVVSPQNRIFKIYSSFWRNFMVSRELKSREIDIFHGLSNELPKGIHKTEIPSVVTIHDLIFIRFPEFYKTIDRNIYFSKVKYACSSAQKIIAISEQTRDDIIRFFHVDSNKIEVVYQSVSPVFFERVNSENLRSKYNLKKQFILSVGTHEPRKNQLSLLKAIKAEKLDIQVVFVGKHTSYTKKLNRFISENKMDGQVNFLNGISENDLAGLYRLATLSVYISFFEGFGLPVIESMASGCPVITSNVSCLPETAGRAAVLCAPNDINELGRQIKSILENETIRNVLVEKGLERAKIFHPEHFSNKMISLYNEILF
ncbi:MAG TPA: glycosyltransferase family 1 protein [Draconibacterium sp.]|nr:glycosyltransferase family 1 protein [Draconibacterium sp.]